MPPMGLGTNGTDKVTRVPIGGIAGDDGVGSGIECGAGSGARCGAADGASIDVEMASY